MAEKTKAEIIKCLEKAAELLKGDSDRNTHVPVGPEPDRPTHDQAPAAFQYSRQLALNSNIRNIFRPYRGNTKKSSNTHVQPTSTQSTWTHRYTCLWSRDSDTVPNKEERRVLFEAGLGDKKITFVRNSSPRDFIEKLEEIYPKLKGCGGLELLRTSGSSRASLKVINPGPDGYTSEYLASSYLGQATCYIRPIQEDLDVSPLEEEHTKHKETCKECGESVPLVQLRSHISMCRRDAEDDLDDLAPLPKKRNIQAPVCQFACVVDKAENNFSTPSASRDKIASCPICEQSFPCDSIALHAASCGEKDTTTPHQDLIRPDIVEPLIDLLLRKGKEQFSDDIWNISVIRKKALETILDQLHDATEEDWKMKLTVVFIGEEGVDVGGPRREMFSLFFQAPTLIENGFFTFSGEHLQEKSYFLLGRAVSYAIITGHPGPQNLHPLLVNYILNDETPQESSITLKDIGNAAVVHAINEITDCQSDYDSLAIEHAELLEKAGFLKVLSATTKAASIQSIKMYWTFYRILGPIRQFMNGLKDKGVLDELKSHPEEGRQYLGLSVVAADTVKKFFKYSLSEDVDKKQLEEVVVYNFHKFLSRVERGNVSSIRLTLPNDEDASDDTLDRETDVPKEEAIAMRDVLQAVLGCPAMPTDIETGLVLFDHNSDDKLSTVNTCAPSLTLRGLQTLQNYNKFEESMLNIIVGSNGFGME